MRAVWSVTYNGIISNPQNWRFTRASALQSSFVEPWCKVENGADAAMKTVNDTTASGASATIFNAMVRFSLRVSACSARLSIIGSRCLLFRKCWRRHLQKRVFQRRVFEAEMGHYD